ncbi:MULTISPECIES: BCCT family transporter [unclassified Acinetobacter]|uniref:BCCT family transporter n=1 Tax=unclassified Acinetobacter TaxID=196816 RepID=UPI0024476B7F|nr:MULTISPECIES: BCCT family transporter [unclassified Acinetobacter]MDH0032255.1 BCCT family transporter [Acinetobacter sp. GD04021]MDH0887541.1 BCCT family transporter [Acinetobacter sp. GD03873]MDH1084201.1 BCCT family transporter [Acinetobacter sp. GD03983]MDH2190845.1 BCCT family transporter [Acinetobacter sp. GD03645]MDH2203884.1 BCCT family transporter [Acinetobacter sp. GD03647]
MRTTTKVLSGLNPTVTIVSKVLLFLFIAFCIFYEKQAGEYFGMISNALLTNAKWYLLFLATFLVGFLIYLCMSRFGHIRLGKDNEKPEYSNIAWICMLFSCGMGIGLMFWSVAEPISHYANNPFTKDFSDESARMAMQLTFFHWGLHPWALFSLSAVALGYFAYRKDLPLACRSVLHPFIGDKIYGTIGNIVDITTIVLTAFGVSQAISMGILELNVGLNHSFGINIDVKIQLVLVLILGVFATLSLLSAISKGFKMIAEGNMVLSYFLVIAVILIGSTRYIFNAFFEGLGDYLQNIVGMSLWSDAQKDTAWQSWWTAYYWPWWMTWAPFVGLFIARISRGRTIREVILGSLAAPTLLTFIWIAAFGGAALKIEKANHQQPATQEVVVKKTQSSTPSAGKTTHEVTIAEATKEDPARAVFVFFDHLSSNHTTTLFLSALLCLLLSIHIITIANSGALVLCFLDTNGSTNPSVGIRLTWAVIIPLISGGLLLAGGLSAIKTACVIAGFPISILLMVMCASLIKSLRQDPQAWVMMPEHLRPDEFKSVKESVDSTKN